jgi:hypothetical protein
MLLESEILPKSTENAISRENKKKGKDIVTRDNNQWFVNHTDDTMLHYTHQPVLLEGFATRFSHFPSDLIDFKMDTALNKDFAAKKKKLMTTNSQTCEMTMELRIYRLGYYGSAGARLVDTVMYTSKNSIGGTYDIAYSRHFFSDSDVGDDSSRKSGSNPTSRFVHSQQECLVLLEDAQQDNEERRTVVDCDNWQVSVSWQIPADAATGIYVALPVLNSVRGCDLTTELSKMPLKGLHIPFVVKSSTMKPYFNTNNQRSVVSSENDEQWSRDWREESGAEGKGTIVFRTADLTWAAYNKYGGWNLYQGPKSSVDGSKNTTKDTFASRTRTVSYNRPSHNRLPFPLGQAQNFLFGTEFAMLYFLERLGYNVVYISCEDNDILHAAGYFKDSGKSKRIAHEQAQTTLLSVGHDEYWTAAMLKSHVDARNQGTNLAYFSGNEMFWRVAWVNRGDEAKGRLVRCNKDTIDVRVDDSKSRIDPPSSEWTGTFVDPLQPKGTDTVLPHSLTGQYFMVNAYRSDSLHVSKEAAKLRFWRNTGVDKRHSGWESFQGILGYEWDATATSLCSAQRPDGLLTLSASHFQVEGQVMQDHGANYKGSGRMVHKLATYRYQPCRHAANTNEKNCPSSLVFAAGTVQWAWGLSTWHDGDHITGKNFDTVNHGIYKQFHGNIPPVDPELQQATMNLLADMGSVPVTPSNFQPRLEGDVMASTSSFSSTSFRIDRDVDPTFQYTSPTPSKDKTPPISTIQNAKIVRYDGWEVFTVTGIASDVGENMGIVSSVEVSVDGGLTWKIGQLTKGVGRQDVPWRMSISMARVEKEDEEALKSGQGGMPNAVVRQVEPHQWGSCQTTMEMPTYKADSSACKSENVADKHVAITIVSRAVDDSGWIERVPSLNEIVTLKKDAPSMGCRIDLKPIHLKNNVMSMCLPICAG